MDGIGTAWCDRPLSLELATILSVSCKHTEEGDQFAHAEECDQFARVEKGRSISLQARGGGQSIRKHAEDRRAIRSQALRRVMNLQAIALRAREISSQALG